MNANPTFTATVNASVGRKRQPIDNIGSLPSVVFDPEMLTISEVLLHGSLGTTQSMSVKQAIEKRLLEVAPYGHRVLVFIKSRQLQVRLAHRNINHP